MGVTENTLRVKLEVTGDGQLKAALGDSATATITLSKAQEQQVAAAAAVSAAMDDTSKATTAAAEATDDAAARIKAMVQASLEASAAQGGVTESARSLIERQAQAATAVDRQAAAAANAAGKLGELDRVQREINERGARLNAADDARKHTASAQAIDDERDALNRLLREIDPTVAGFEKLDAQQEKLRQFRAKGMLPEDDFQHFTATIDKNRAALGAAGEAMSHLQLNSAGVRREIGVLIGELAQGNFSNFEGSLATLANRSGLLSLALTPVGLAVGGVVAAIGVLAAGAIAGERETERLRVSLIATGQAAGESAASLNQMAEEVGSATGRYSAARAAVEGLAASGKVAGAGIAGLAKQAVDMSTVTGQSIDQAVAKILEINDRPSAAIAALNEQYHILTAAQYAEIAALEAEGNSREASRRANELDAQAMAARAREVEDNAGLMERAGHAVAVAWGGAWDAIKGVGRPSGLAEQAAALQKQIDALSRPRVDRQGNLVQANNGPEIARLQQELQTLNIRRFNEGLTGVDQSIEDQANAEGIAAQRRLAQYAAPADKRDNELKKAAADRLAALYGVVDPAQRAEIERQYQTQVKTVENNYAAAVKKLAGPKGPKNDPFASLNGLVQGAQVFDAGIGGDKQQNEQVTKILAIVDAGAKLITQGQDVATVQAKVAQGVAALNEGYAKQADQLKEQTTVAVQQYQASLDQQNAALQRSIDSQIAHIGMGDKEYQRQEQINALYEKSADAMTQLVLRRAAVAAKGGDTSELDQDIARLQANTDVQVAIVSRGFERMDASLADWRNGFTSAFSNFRAQALDIAGVVRDGFGGMYRDLNDDAVAWATGQHVSFKNVENDFEQMLARMAIQAAETAATNAFLDWIGFGAGAASSLGGSSWGSGNGVTGGGEYTGNQSLSTSWPGMPSRAEGGPITGRGTSTSDSVIARVSVGENVITARATQYYGQRFMDDVNDMRLPRFAAGGLVGGAAGGGAGAAPKVTVNLIGAPEGSSVQQRQQGDGSQIIDVLIGKVAQDIAGGGRTAQAISGAFGVRRAARSYAPAGN